MLPTVSRRVAVQPTRGQLRSEVSRGGGSSCCCLSCCGCCRCCGCLNFGFLKTQLGLLKIAEMALGGICQALLVKYGLGYSASLGHGYSAVLTTSSACLFTTGVLLLCYLVSSTSIALVRQSLFETLFNGIASVLYVAASGLLSFTVQSVLWPQYVVTPYFQVYPALTAAYCLGIAVGLVHGYDTYLAYRWYRGRQ
ncbi:protein singles bar-like [Amphibalanus amphitrite]|uniref:protein singles bar-like n=1 Tax=Amphibalanus amphitrite TaxID=1232801 RepID=UPI001C8FEAF8|nr:protein singles bar-like [Amphibalanus amphitrite]